MTKADRRARRREIRAKAPAKPGHDAWMAANFVPSMQLLLPKPPLKGVSYPQAPN